RVFRKHGRQTRRWHCCRPVWDSRSTPPLASFGCATLTCLSCSNRCGSTVCRWAPRDSIYCFADMAKTWRSTSCIAKAMPRSKFACEAAAGPASGKIAAGSAAQRDQCARFFLLALCDFDFDCEDARCGRLLRGTLAMRSSSRSVMDSTICLDAPRKRAFGISPRLAASAAPAAFCCCLDLAGMSLLHSRPLENATESGRSCCVKRGRQAALECLVADDARSAGVLSTYLRLHDHTLLPSIRIRIDRRVIDIGSVLPIRSARYAETFVTFRDHLLVDLTVPSKTHHQCRCA